MGSISSIAKSVDTWSPELQKYYQYGTVQCSAVHSSTVQCSAVQCSAVQCSAVQCSAVQCSAVQCSAVQCSAVQCSAVQCSAVQCSAVQCSAVQCSAVQCSIFDGCSNFITNYNGDFTEAFQQFLQSYCRGKSSKAENICAWLDISTI